jgi:two-component system LytT family response regulator
MARRAIIVDDEELARGIIREHLSAHPDITVVAECANGFEAVKAIADLKPDILFLDIQMPKLTGFEVLELLETPPAVVFVTAYDSFALRAFDVHAVDYLLKPFSKERFADAVRRALAGAAARSTAIGALVREARAAGKPLERILIRDGQNVHVIPVATVAYVEAQDDYVAIHAAGKRYLKLEALAELEETLDQARFVRIHRSYIVNIDVLVRLEPYGKDNHVAVLTGGVRLPVSRSGYDRLKGLL